MCVCVSVFIYIEREFVCACVYVNIYIRVCLYVYMHIYMCVYLCVYLYMKRVLNVTK